MVGGSWSLDFRFISRNGCFYVWTTSDAICFIHIIRAGPKDNEPLLIKFWLGAWCLLTAVVEGDNFIWRLWGGSTVWRVHWCNRLWEKNTLEHAYWSWAGVIDSLRMTRSCLPRHARAFLIGFTSCVCILTYGFVCCTVLKIVST